MNTVGSLSHVNGLRELVVLVVDGDPASTRRTLIQLEDANCDAVCLANYLEALAYLQANTRPLDLVLVDGRLPHLSRLVSGVCALPIASTLPQYVMAGCRLHEYPLPGGTDGLLPKPLPFDAALYYTLYDLRDTARGIADRFVPMEHAAAQAGLTLEQTRRQFYVPVLAEAGPVVRAADVAMYVQYAGGFDYSDPIQHAFRQGAWRDLSWRSRACLFNTGLPEGLHLNWRALKRIAQGQDKELARAIRVLAALDLKLGLDLEALAGSVLSNEEVSA